MIAGYYLEAMDAPPESEDAQTITWITDHFDMPAGSRDVIRRIIREVRECAKEGTVYTGERTGSPRTELMAIPLGSVAAAIIAESMEDGAGIRRAHLDVLDWLYQRVESGKQDVQWWGLSATYSCYLRMNPTVTVVQKRAQGSDDPESAWCQAFKGWATQLLLRTQQNIPEE